MSKLEEIKEKYADFDWHTFDIEISDYFYLKNHPEEEDAQAIDKLYEQIYAQVAEKCNESGEYTIDCFNNRYTVRKISEVEQIHYEAMSDEEKAEYDLNKKNQAINNRRYERDIILREKVDPVVSNPLRWESLSEEEKENYKNYRLYLLDIPQQENFPNEEILSFEDFVISHK